MVQLYVNPLSMQTASCAWRDQNHSLPMRLLTTTAGAVYDTFVKNPYDLSIGNAKAFFRADTTREKVAALAACCLGTCYSLMLFGTTLHLAGRAVSVLAMSKDLPVAYKVATFVQNFGKNLFVAGGVPIYAAFYALPKKIISVLPELAWAVAQKMKVVAAFVFTNIVRPICNRVIFPILKKLVVVLEVAVRKIAYAIELVFKHVIYPAVRICVKKLSSVVQFVFKNAIVPLWQNIVFPALKCLGHSMRIIVKATFQSLTFLMRKTYQVSSWIFTNIVAPICKRLIFPVVKALYTSISYLVSKTADAALWLFKNVITPIAKPIINMTFTACNWVVNQFDGTLMAAIKHTVRAVQALFNQVLTTVQEGAAAVRHVISYAL